jgi:hypothetical protein
MLQSSNCFGKCSSRREWMVKGRYIATYTGRISQPAFPRRKRLYELIGDALVDATKPAILCLRVEANESDVKQPPDHACNEYIHDRCC